MFESKSLELDLEFVMTNALYSLLKKPTLLKIQINLGGFNNNLFIFCNLNATLDY